MSKKDKKMVAKPADKKIVKLIARAAYNITRIADEPVWKDTSGIHKRVARERVREVLAGGGQSGFVFHTAVIELARVLGVLVLPPLRKLGAKGKRQEAVPYDPMAHVAQGG